MKPNAQYDAIRYNYHAIPRGVQSGCTPVNTPDDAMFGSGCSFVHLNPIADPEEFLCLKT